MFKIVLWLVTIILCWVIVMTISPFLIGDFFYWVESPVPIVSIYEKHVTMKFLRFARIPMTATYTNELQCKILYQFGEEVGVLEKGHNTFVYSLSLPVGAQGSCQYRGSITYKPFGVFGPPFVHFWESNTFSPK